MTHRFHPSILREYDIRGVAGDTLHAADAYALGRSFGTVVQRAIRTGAIRTGTIRTGAGGARVAVGYDGRLSSPMLEAALVQGLTDSGIHVRRIGMGPTPLLYFAEASAEDVEGGIQVTGSHNPADHNGFKMVLEGRPFFGPDIVALGEMAAAGDWDSGTGTVEEIDLLDTYIDRLLRGLDGITPEVLAKCQIGWDAGNGAAGPAVERLTARLPGRHHLLFTHVDGHFPNHHPDPTIPANLADLQRLVSVKSLDFGVAFDGDGDRIGVVDRHGRIVWGDQLLAILAEDVLRQRPGATVVADVKASAMLFDRVAALGGQPMMWNSGHAQIKSRMKQVGAMLGGEMSGHVFLADDYYGFDDALYAAVRLLAATVRLGRGVDQLRDALPVLHNTPELRFPVPAARKFAAMAEVAARLAANGADVLTLDGVRVTTPDGWWLLRASNTQEVLTARAESATEAGLARLLAESTHSWPTADWRGVQKAGIDGPEKLGTIWQDQTGVQAMGKSTLWLGAAALVFAASSVAAQDKPDTSVVTDTAVVEDLSGLEGYFDNFPAPAPLTPEQIERLPLATALAEKVLPPGSLRMTTGGTFGMITSALGQGDAASARDVVTRRLGGYLDDTNLTEADVARIAEMLDPQWAERDRRMRDFTQQAMGQMFEAFEPPMRQALAELYAIHFSAAELAEIDAFFATPTGAAYASRSYLMTSDPRMMQAMMPAMPAIFGQMAAMEAEAAEVVADLPPQRNYADLSLNERKALARLLGIAPEELQYSLMDAADTAF